MYKHVYFTLTTLMLFVEPRLGFCGLGRLGYKGATIRYPRGMGARNNYEMNKFLFKIGKRNIKYLHPSYTYMFHNRICEKSAAWT